MIICYLRTIHRIRVYLVNNYAVCKRVKRGVVYQLEYKWWYNLFLFIFYSNRKTKFLIQLHNWFYPFSRIFFKYDIKSNTPTVEENNKSLKEFIEANTLKEEICVEMNWYRDKDENGKWITEKETTHTGVFQSKLVIDDELLDVDAISVNEEFKEPYRDVCPIGEHIVYN